MAISALFLAGSTQNRPYRHFQLSRRQWLAVAFGAVVGFAEHLAVGDVNRPAHHETPEKRPFRGVSPCVPPIGRTYGVTEDLTIMRERADLLNYPPSTTKCRSSHGPKALLRMKTEDWRNTAGREQCVPPGKTKQASSDRPRSAGSPGKRRTEAEKERRTQE